MRFQALCLAACLVALPFAAQKPQTKTTPDTTARRSNSGRGGVSRVAISPDGTMLAYSMRGREGTELHLAPTPTDNSTIDQSKDKLVTPSDATSCSNTDPVWSPDSKTLAYTSTCTSKEEKPGQAQIFLFNTADGKSRELTHVTGSIAQAEWSPDGKSIAFLFVENATRTAGALDAMKPLVGVIGKDTFELQTIAVIVGVDKGGNIPVKLTTFPNRPELYVYEFSWAPDSKRVAFIGALPPGENNWWVAKLYTMQAPTWNGDVVSTAKPQVVLDPSTTKTALHGLQIAVPRWSPDGKRIAVIGGLMSDQGSTGGDVWVVNADGKTPPVDVTPGIDGTPTYEAWLGNDAIGMIEDRRGHIVAPDYNVNTRTMVPNSMWDLGEVAVGGGAIKNAISFSNQGLLAFTMSSVAHPTEIYLMHGGGEGTKPWPATNFNANTPASTLRTESVEWENEGFHVQGWLTYPANYDPHKKYPIIVSVHGGPTSSARAGYGTYAAQGYFEFAPNPRGSMGQGEKFVQANVKDFGYGDLRDILKGLDYVEAKVPAIDHTREGITGWSYGGYMTMFAVTKTTRFKAAIAGAGIANWQSYYGENSIDQWMIPFFGASVYDDPAVYAKSSPITFIKNVKTPTLVLVGERDGECPAPQSFEFWHALRDLGVPTELVVYPNEGHGFRDPEHIKDRSERMAKWFAEYLK